MSKKLLRKGRRRRRKQNGEKNAVTSLGTRQTALHSVELKPGSAWVLATGCFAFMALAVYFGIMVLGDLRQQLIYEQFAQRLGRSSYIDSRQLLTKSFENLWIYEKLKNAFSSRPLLTPQQRLEALSDFHTVIEKLEQNEFTGAVRTFNSLRNGNLHTLRLAMPPTSSTTQLLSNIDKQFEAYHDKVDKLVKISSKNPEKAAENERFVEQIALGAADLAYEFGALLGSDPVDVAKGEFIVPFYKEGVLRDLPLLRGIPDNLETLSDLKDALNRVGATVNISGPNAHEEFAEKLEDLRKRGKIFRGEMETRLDENKELTGDLTDLKREVFKTGKDLEIQARKFLLEAMRPQGNLLAERLYLVFWG